jgi:hypothetical protein
MAPTASFVGPDIECQVDVEARLFPVTELPLPDHEFDVFAALPLKRELPIVDDSGSIGGQVCHPPISHQLEKHGCQPVLDGMRSERNHHRPVISTRGPHPAGHFRDEGLGSWRQRLRLRPGRHVVLFDALLVVAIRQRLHSDGEAIKLGIRHG